MTDQSDTLNNTSHERSIRSINFQLNNKLQHNHNNSLHNSNDGSNFQLNGVEDESFLDDFSDFADDMPSGSRAPPPNITDDNIFSYVKSQAQCSNNINDNNNNNSSINNGNSNSNHANNNSNNNSTNNNFSRNKPTSPSNSQVFSNYGVEQKYQPDPISVSNSFYQPYTSNAHSMLSSAGNMNANVQQQQNVSFSLKKQSSTLDRPALQDIRHASSSSIGGKSSSGQSNASHSDSSKSSRFSESTRNEISPDPRKRVADKKRQDRNSREQQRSFKISKQIDQLKHLLEESGFKVKNSKYDILAGVASYVKQLQSRSTDIQNEIRSMDQQISVKSANIIPQDPMNLSQLSSGKSPEPQNHPLSSTLPVIVNSSSSRIIDPFKTIASAVSDRNFRQYFMQSPIALALAAIDGRIFECNQCFQDITGLQKEHVLHASIFKLVDPSMLQEAYINIGLLLQHHCQPGFPTPQSSSQSFLSNASSPHANPSQRSQKSYDSISTLSSAQKSSTLLMPSGQTSVLGSADMTKSPESESGECDQRSFFNSSQNQGSGHYVQNSSHLTGKRSRSSMEQSQAPASSITKPSPSLQAEANGSKSFQVKSLIISAYDGKHLCMAVGVLTPDTSPDSKSNFYPTASHQPCFSIALLPG